MPSIEECNRLFIEHLEWSKLVARRVASQLPPSFPVEDLEQEAALELWRQISRYDPAKNDNVRGYAYLAVRGACLMTARRKWYTESTHDPLAPSVIAEGSNPADIYDKRTQEQRVRRKELGQLREIVRRLAAFPVKSQFAAYVVRRVHLEGTAVPEMALITGITEARIHRALSTGFRLLKRG